jgi:hypothetical protein
MHRSSSFALVAIPLLAACTSTQGKTYTSDEWQHARHSLGKVAILPPRLHLEESAAEVQAQLEAVLGVQPGAELADAAPLLATLGDPTLDAPISDLEAILAARELGVDSVCLLTVAEYGGYFQVVLIPPFWRSETTVAYGLRILDARSGKLLLEAVRSRSTGGFFAIRRAAHRPRELAEDLLVVLGAAGDREVARAAADAMPGPLLAAGRGDRLTDCQRAD